MIEIKVSSESHVIGKEYLTMWLELGHRQVSKI